MLHRKLLVKAMGTIAPIATALLAMAFFSDDIDKKMKEDEEMEELEKKLWESRHQKEGSEES